MITCPVYSIMSPRHWEPSLFPPAQAAYLAKAGKSVAVLERRHVLGGTAVTEEIIRGFKFSRASYLLSLLRPQIVKDLELKVNRAPFNL